MTATIALFACGPLGARLTRDACARRHVASLRTGRHRDDVQRVYSRVCEGCAVGAAHARGDLTLADVRRLAAWLGTLPLDCAEAAE